MILTRRRLLQVGGGCFVTLSLGSHAGHGGEPVDIVMTGDGAGARVSFDPVGLLVRPGQTIRWTNRDRGNVHTATAYHPDNDGRPLRIPRAATAWDSGYLMPGECFSVTLTEPGVYDYFCVPHEMAGMAGRVLVSGEDVSEMPPHKEEGAEIPAAVLDVLPAVDKILEAGVVRHRECGRKDRCS